MKNFWVNASLDMAGRKADLYSGCRKIIRPVLLSMPGRDLASKDRLEIIDSGFTKSKMTMLTKNYLHHESRDVALQLWDKRLGQAKYGSVGFTCYAHFVKGGSIDAKRSKRASVFGPCIQSVVLTYVDKSQVDIDVFYRTTELFKKFPADLVFLRDVLLDRFDTRKVGEVRFHFANVTCHPMYFVTLVPHLEDPEKYLVRIKKQDKYFHDWIVKWTARYVCDEHSRGIQKFAQALRVQQDARSRIDRRKMKDLQCYLRDNHPGHRNAYEDDDNED